MYIVHALPSEYKLWSGACWQLCARPLPFTHYRFVTIMISNVARTISFGTFPSEWMCTIHAREHALAIRIVFDIQYSTIIVKTVSAWI